MKFLLFVRKHARRTWIRTGSTVAAIAVCVALFCTLQAALAKVGGMIKGRSPHRLVTQHAVSFIFPLPLSHAEQIKTVPGVKRVAAVTIFGGLLSARKEGKEDPAAAATTDWTNYFPNVAARTRAPRPTPGPSGPS